MFVKREAVFSFYFEGGLRGRTFNYPRDGTIINIGVEWDFFASF